MRREFAVPDIIYEFNVAGLLDHPIRTLIYGLLLQSAPLNLDLLQLYIVLMVFFPPVLWLMLRKPDFALAGSAVLYFAARRFDWNLRIRSLTASGISTRFAGNCCSCSAPGSRSAERKNAAHF